MSKRAVRNILGSIMLLVILSASTSSPFVQTIPIDNRLDQDPLDIHPEDHPEWEEIIREAFQSLGISDILFNKDMSDYYVKYPYMSSAMGIDTSRNWIIGFIISPKKYEWEYTTSTKTFDSTTFHSYPATIATQMNIKEQPFAKLFEWIMGDLYYYASVTYDPGSGPTMDDLVNLADALYNAASGSTTPSKPANVPSDPEIDEPQNNPPPGDLCANVTCKNNYCKDDGSKYMHDCQCSPEDGKCICRFDTCEFGCDENMGGCITGENDLCADVTCPDDFCSEDGSEYFHDCYCDGGNCYCSSTPCEAGCDAGGCLGMQMDICEDVACPEDYCEEDGKTRVYDCKCDPADGECGCLVEVCESGCNAGTGKCEITMVIPADQDDTGSSGGGYIPPAPDGPGLLGVVGGVAAGGGVLAGAGYLGYKAVQAALARQAAKAAAKAAAQAAEPSLSELLARAERSADRVSAAIDDGLKANAIDARNYREFLGRTTAQNEDWAETMARRARNIEWAEKGVRWTKKGADVTAELLGNVPGAGTTFKYTYNLTTTAAESIASGDSVGTVALKTTGKAMETVAGDAMFGKVTLLKNLPTRMSMRTIKIATRQVGPHYLAGEGLKNEVTLETMNWLKAKKSATWFGKVEKGLAKAGKKIDTKFIGKTIKKVLYTK